MQTFRHHHTGQTVTARTDDEVAEYDADPLLQRLDDGEVEPDAQDDGEPEPTLDDFVEQLGNVGPERRNLLREALAQFDDQDDDAGGRHEAFDPSTHNLADVQAYLKSLDVSDADALAEHARVIAAEKAGSAPRKGVLDLDIASTN